MDKSGLKREMLSIIRDIVIAAIVVGLMLGSIVLYTGNWPPLVVVESGSMMHTEGASGVGVIDPGDLVLVKEIDDRNDVVTYVEGVESLDVRAYTEDNGVINTVFDRTISGRKAPHNTYDEPGDVIVYYKNGISSDTPIIHRAILWVEYNETTDSFDFPDIGLYDFVGTLELYPVGYKNSVIHIDFEHILNSGFAASGAPHAGFITLGDHNLNLAPTTPEGNYDQRWLPDIYGRPMELINVSWVLGKARGELPWFGAIKLYFGDEGNSQTVGKGAVPPNSWRNLFLTVAGLIALAISMDILAFYLGLRRQKEKEEPGELAEESIQPGSEGMTEPTEDNIGHEPPPEEYENED